MDSSKSPHKFDEILADNIERIDAQRTELLKTQAELITTIGKVKDNTLQTILRDKYINGKSFERIAESLGYTPQWTKELNGKALLRVYDIITK